MRLFIILLFLCTPAWAADIVSPLPNDVFQSGDQVVITVSEPGAASVEGFVDGVTLGLCPQVGADFECIWIATEGAHEITATATISNDALPVSVTVSAAPPSGPGIEPYLPLPGEWVNIPNSGIGPALPTQAEFGAADCQAWDGCENQAALFSWVGMAFDEINECWYALAGGGHSDYGGNESYRYCLVEPERLVDGTGGWQRIVDPVSLIDPMTSAFTADKDGDGILESCPVPIGSPPARHTYDGLQWIPSTGKIMVEGISAYCSNGWAAATGGSGFWIFDPVSLTWEERPELESVSSYGRTDIDPENGDILYWWWVRVLTIDPVTYEIKREGRKGQNMRAGTGTFHPVLRKFFLNNDSSLWATDIPVEGDPAGDLIDWPIKVETWSDFGLIDMGEAGMAYYPVTGEMALWRADGKIHFYDPVTRQLRTELGGPVSGLQGRVESQFRYLPNYDVFMGYERDGGWWLYRPFEQSPPPPLPETEAGLDPSSSLAQLCALPSTWLCDPLDNTPISGRAITWNTKCLTIDAVLTDSDNCRWFDWRSIPVLGEGFGRHRPELDLTKGDGGALKFTLEGPSASGGPGEYTVEVTPDRSFVFGPGSAMRVRFKMQMSCDYLYMDCDPSSPTYKTDRREYADQFGGVTGPKIFGLGEAQRMGVTYYINNCDGNLSGLVNINGRSAGYPSVYSGCPWYTGLSGSGPRVDGIRLWDMQPGGDNKCWLKDPENGWERGDDCFMLEPDEWLTFQADVQYGGCTTSVGDPARRTKYRLWIAREGQPFTLVVDAAMNSRCPVNFDPDVGGYGSVTLTLHMTKKDAEEIHPEAYVWVDDLWISELVYDGLTPDHGPLLADDPKNDDWIAWSGGQYVTAYP